MAIRAGSREIASIGQHRTRLLSVENHTDRMVGLWYAQIRNMHGEVAPGFTADTGVFIASVRIAPFSAETSDPCALRGGDCHACQGDEVTGTLRVVDEFGDETDVVLESALTTPGRYLPEVRWALAYRDLGDGNRELYTALVGVETASGQR